MKKSEDIIKLLSETNNPDYQLLKACEELSELTTALLQYVNKKGTKTTKKDVIDEIGDVKIRIKVLEKTFGEKAVNKRFNFKINKFKKYFQKKLYIGRI